MDLKKHIFDRAESTLRAKIINEAVKVELAINIIIKMAFGIKRGATHSFDKSSSLSFSQKVNLLFDIYIIMDNAHRIKFTKFAEIRNEFAYKFAIKSFEACNAEILRFL